MSNRKSVKLERTICNIESEDTPDRYLENIEEQSMLLAGLHQSPMLKEGKMLEHETCDDPAKRLRNSIKDVRIREPRLVIMETTEGVSPVTSQKNSFIVKSSQGSQEEIVNHINKYKMAPKPSKLFPVVYSSDDFDKQKRRKDNKSY